MANTLQWRDPPWPDPLVFFMDRCEDAGIAQGWYWIKAGWDNGDTGAQCGGPFPTEQEARTHSAVTT